MESEFSRQIYDVVFGLLLPGKHSLDSVETLRTYLCTRVIFGGLKSSNIIVDTMLMLLPFSYNGLGGICSSLQK